MNKFEFQILSLLFIFAAALHANAGDDFKPSPKLIEQGRYIVKITGCNDCHTVGYNEANGNVPEKDWLKGSTVGFRGPWGTSYPVNLRHKLHTMTEEQWVQYAKNFKALPPMPWFNVNAMTTLDLKSIYHFVRSLGDDNTEIPEPLAPGIVPHTPYINFEVVMP